MSPEREIDIICEQGGGDEEWVGIADSRDHARHVDACAPAKRNKQEDSRAERNQRRGMKNAAAQAPRGRVGRFKLSHAPPLAGRRLSGGGCGLLPLAGDADGLQRAGDTDESWRGRLRAGTPLRRGY